MQIALIGAGPRNLALLARLTAYAKQSHQKTDIHLFDPAGIGGKVWRPNQDPTFIMNTVTSQLTLFTDTTIEHFAPALQGPSFYQWACDYGNQYVKNHNFENEAVFLNELATIDPNRFSSRALFGVYTQWFFDEIMNNLAAEVQVHFYPQSVTRIQRHAAQFKIQAQTDLNLTVDQVILAPGHAAQINSPEDENLADFAQAEQLLYLPANHPADAPLEKIQAQQNVILRGLGLSFFDYMAKLTIGRGGHFTRDSSGKLSYQPAGTEPHLIAGSRHGVPLHARGVNQKIGGQSYQPRFFTPAALDHFAEKHNGHVSFDFFIHLLKKEMSYKHYFNVVSDTAINWAFAVTDFLQALNSADDLDATAKAWGLPEQQIINWATIIAPFDNAKNVNVYQQTFLAYLINDIQDARLGNRDAPFAGAFDLLRDVRSTIRYYVTNNYLNDAEYARFLQEFNPFNNIVSVGPPVARVEQMAALMEAGILTLVGPGMQVQCQPANQQHPAQFLVTDHLNQQFEAQQLVEARLHGINVKTSADPLIQDLVDQKMLNTRDYQKNDGQILKVGGAMIDRKTMRVLDENNQPVAGLRLWGALTEGWSWFTTFSPRPNSHDKILQDAENIANDIFTNL